MHEVMANVQNGSVLFCQFSFVRFGLLFLEGCQTSFFVNHALARHLVVFWESEEQSPGFLWVEYKLVIVDPLFLGGQNYYLRGRQNCAFGKPFPVPCQKEGF